MQNITRRDLLAAVSALSVLGAAGVESTFSQAASAKDERRGDSMLSKSQTFDLDSLPVTNNGNGGVMRRVISGTLPTGEFIEVHETTLPARCRTRRIATVTQSCSLSGRVNLSI